MEEFCCATVFTDYTHHNCSKRANVVRDGKPYCGIHDPVRVKERQEKREAVWQKERDEYNKQHGIEYINASAAFKEECVKAVKLIAEGHADAQLLCASLVAREPKL